MDAGVVAIGCEDDDTNNDDDVGDAAASSCSPTKFYGEGTTPWLRRVMRLMQM